MEHGNETEPQAVLKFAEKLGKTVEDEDFIYTSIGGFIFFYDDEYDLGGTPDVIIKDTCIAEIKCPLSKTHLQYMTLQTSEEVASTLPNYYGQMQLNMYLTQTNKCDFISFDDRFYNPEHHYHSIEIPRDEEYISRMLTKAKYAKEYKENLIKILNQKSTKK